MYKLVYNLKDNFGCDNRQFSQLQLLSDVKIYCMKLALDANQHPVL